MKFLFGPVPSRRLGNSLGIDLIPLKTCTLNCIYCECGQTTNQTCELKEHVPYFQVINEFSEWINDGGTADYITFAGSGEPTLHSRLGDIIDYIKNLTDIPVCVITNSTLLHIPEVLDQVCKADLVIPSLDAAGLGVFRKINRPLPDLNFKQVISGLKNLTTRHKNVWLEIFLVPGINDSDGSIARLSEIATEIGAQKIQLNTAVRPPASSEVKAVPPAKIKEIAAKFSPLAEIIASYENYAPEPEATPCSPELILELISRRPCTLDDICNGLSINKIEAKKMLLSLFEREVITSENLGGTKFYIGAEQSREN